MNTNTNESDSLSIIERLVIPARARNTGKYAHLTPEEQNARRLRLCNKYGISFFSDVMFDDDDKPYRLPIATCGM